MAAVKPVQRRTYRGRTAEERAATRRDLLLQSAFALVAERGWRELSIDAVCRHAGLNKRYFYETFEGLDGLILALTTQLADDAIAVTLAEVEPDARRAEATRRGITAFIEHLTDDPRRARVLFGAVPAADLAAGHRTAAIRRLIATVASQGRNLYAISDDAAVELTAAMLIGGTSQAVLDWLDGRADCSRGALIDHLVAQWQAIGEAARQPGLPSSGSHT